MLRIVKKKNQEIREIRFLELLQKGVILSPVTLTDKIYSMVKGGKK